MQKNAFDVTCVCFKYSGRQTETLGQSLRSLAHRRGNRVGARGLRGCQRRVRGGVGMAKHHTRGKRITHFETSVIRFLQATPPLIRWRVDCCFSPRGGPGEPFFLRGWARRWLTSVESQGGVMSGDSESFCQHLRERQGVCKDTAQVPVASCELGPSGPPSITVFLHTNKKGSLSAAHLSE